MTSERVSAIGFRRAHPRHFLGNALAHSMISLVALKIGKNFYAAFNRCQNELAFEFEYVSTEWRLRIVVVSFVVSLSPPTSCIYSLFFMDQLTHEFSFLT